MGWVEGAEVKFAYVYAPSALNGFLRLYVTAKCVDVVARIQCQCRDPWMANTQKGEDDTRLQHTCAAVLCAFYRKIIGTHRADGAALKSVMRL